MGDIDIFLIFVPQMTNSISDMKKILLFAIGLLTSVTMLAEDKPYTVSETGFMYEYDIEKKTATFAGVLEANKNVKYAVVQSSIKGSDGLDYPVTAIGKEAFKGCSSLRLLTLPETLTSIASNAFSDCKDLKHIYCKVLNPTNILNPGGLPSYSDAKMVTLYVETNESKSNYENDPNWNTKYSRILVGPMSSEPFKYKDGKDDLTGMFYVCAEGSKEATLFTGKNEKDIVVPKTIIYNGDNYNVTGIDRLAFDQFSEIEKLWLPETLTDISNYAFNGCSNLIYIGLEQTQSPRYKPSVFPSNELMSLFISESLYDNLNSQWDNSQFDDRIYNGKMIEVPYQGMKYLCADRTSDGDAILVTGKDGISYLGSIEFDGKYYSLKGIGKSAFENCTLITSLNISYGVTTISNSAFKGCSNLQSLTLPSSLKTIGSYAFSGCSNLSKLPSLSGLLSLGSYAFSGCSKLQDLKLPSSLTTIGNNAFNGCSNIRTLDIPYNLKSIGSGAFNGCSSLAHIRCRVTDPSKLDPANLPSNEMMTLYVDKNYSGNYINSTDFKTTWKAKFNGRIYEGDWKDNVEIDGMYYICSPVSKKATLYKGNSKTDITISDINDGNDTYSVTGIDRQAFKGSSLEKLTLPNTITHIGPEAFSGCSSLDRVVSYIETPFKINENVFSTAKKLYVPENTRENYKGFAGWKKFSYMMEGEPISVENEAGTFVCASKSKEAILTIGNKQTTSVTINPSIQDEESNTYQVIAIEKGAFQNSGELVKLTFMDNTGSENSISIGDNAFSSCSKLRVLTLPSKVELGIRVFNGSNNLEYIICKSTSPKIIDNEVFTTTIGTLYVPTSYSGAYNIEGWNKFTKRVECEDMQVHSLDDGMTYEYLSKKVDENTLRTATVIKDSKGSTTVSPKDGILEIKNSVSLPSGGDPYTIVSIAKEAFKGNGKINELMLSDNITTIGESAFQNCSNLQNLKLSSALTTIEDNAFQNCTKLKSFPIPQSLTSIGDNAFAGCTSLTEIVSDGITKLGNSAFKDCTGLINVTIPESLSTIGDYAFNGCTNLTEIINKREEPAAINANVFSNNKTILYVSSESVEDYKNAVGWKDLTILQGLKDEFSDEFNTYSFATGEEFATLTKSLIKESNYTIPDIVKNPKTGIEYKVTAIDRTAFENNATLENLYIPEGVKTIGAKAFYNCTKLKKVELPSSLEFIGDQAFDKCTVINKISSRIPSGNLENLCSKISNVFASGISPKVYIPIEDDSKYETYWSIFKDNLIEGRLDMGNDVTYGWEYEYFTGKIEKIATLTRAFAESTETSATGYLPILGKVKFTSDEDAPEYTVTEIAENAFNEYPTPSRVEKLSIEENITSIGDNAFKVLSNVKKVWLPSTLETIGTNAFNTTSITHVCSEATKLPNSKSEIVNAGKSPYLFVPQNQTATYLNMNGWKNFAETNIYEGYFVDEKTPETYKNLTFLYIQNQKDGETKTAVLTKSKTNTKDVEIPSTVSIGTDSYHVTEIAGAAFSTSSNLINITIPEYVVKIGDNAFSSCTNLKNITCMNPNPVSINSNVFPSNTAALYVPDGVAGSYVLADVWKDFTTIHNGARMVAENKAMGLTYEYASNEVVATLIEGKDKSSVKIDNVAPETSDVKVTSIAESAFENNTSIQSVVIPEGIETIGPKAFQNCSNLTTIEFPSTLTSIGKKAFNGCVKVGTIISYIPYTKLDGLCDFSEVFYTETPISPNIYIPVGDESFSAYTSKWNISEGTKFFQGYSKTTVDGNGWEYAYREGVDDYAVLTKATSSITDNGHLVIPGTLKIGTDDNASEIKVTEIAATAFNAYPDKAKVVKLTISENIKTIRENAFSAFSNVQKLWLPSTLETVEANAFSTNKLNYVCSEATKSPSLASSVFAENKEAYLLVPNVEAYQANINWIGDKIKIYEGYFVDDITPTTDDYSNQTFICLLNKKDGDDKRAILIKSTTNIEDVEIPETVLLGGESYDVKEIAELAFSGSSNLKNITIPSTVNKIGDKAFASCNQILNINCNMIAPIDINANVFPGFTAALYVPASDDPNSEEAPVNKYGKVDVWKDFSVIHNGNRIIKKEDGLIYEYASGESYATLIKGVTAGDVTIENKVPGTEDKTVTSIGESAFIGNTQIKSLTISEGVIKIGTSAFENCSEISKITLPAGLTDIGEKAFAGCTKIDEIITDVDEKELKKIPDNVFPEAELKDKTIVYVPTESELAYRNYEKSGGWSIFNKFVPGKWMGPLTKGNFVYRYHTGYKKATVVGINNSLEDNNLKIVYEVTLNEVPCQVDSIVIAKDGFSHPEVVETLVIGEGIEVIGVNSFKECKNLAYLELPSSLISVGDNAFQGCAHLQKLWLPESLKSIGSNAFNGCNLTRVSYERNELPTINKNVFSNSSNAYLFIPKGTDYNKEVWSNFSRVYEGEYVGESTYEGNKYIYLKQKDESRTAVLLSSSGGLIPNDAISFIDPKTAKENKYSVTIIGKEAFRGQDLSNLERLPESIEIIEANAFQNSKLSNLKSFPSKLKKIGKYAFSGNKIKTLELPSNFEIVEDYAFKDNELLESLTIKDGIQTIGAEAFNGCKSLKELELPNSLKRIGNYAFYNNISLKKLLFSDGLETIGSYSFKGCSNLKMIELPSSVKAIGTGAFDDCNNLTEVISNITVITEDIAPLSLPYATLYIPEGTAASYSEWKCAHILEGDRKLWDKDGLYYAYSAEEKKAILIKADADIKGDITINPITIGEGASAISCDVFAIDKAIFKGNTEITKVTIGENVETIGAYAFEGCSSLRQITLPSTIITIGEHAFDGCSNLTDVVSNIGKNNFDDITDQNVLSIPDVKFNLYVPTGSRQYYKDKGWVCEHIYEGTREEKDINGDGLYYAYSTTDDAQEAILVKVDPEKLSEDVTIPGSVEIKVDDVETPIEYKVIAIDNSVFKDNKKVKSVAIKDNVKTIGVSAFQGCNNLTMVELPSTLEAIGDNAFDGCSSLTAVVSYITYEHAIDNITLSLPNATLYVQDEGTKNYCKGAAGWEFANYFVGSRIEVPVKGLNYVCATGDESAILVGATADFIDKDGLLTIPPTIPVTLGEGESAKDYEYRVIAIDDNVFNGNTDIKAVKIGDNVQKIGAKAFEGCTNLSRIWFPESLEKIGENAFSGCNDIAYISTKCSTPIDIKNVFSVYNKATLYVPNETAIDSYMGDNLWKQFPNKKVGHFVGVTPMDDDVTYECVVKGEGDAKTYEAEAISAKNNEKITINNEVNLDRKYIVTTVGKQAFKGCSKLKKLWLLASLKEIGEKAFYESKNITYICTSSKTPLGNIGENAFNLNADKVTLFVPDKEAKTNYESNDFWNKFKNKKIGFFVDDTTLDKITYECVINGDETTASLVKSESTVTNPEILSSVKLDTDTEYKVTTIGEGAFKDNTALVNLVIPNGIKTIEVNAFEKCSKLTTLSLPSSLRKIESGAFSDSPIATIYSDISGSEILAGLFADISTVFKSGITTTVYIPVGSQESYIKSWNISSATFVFTEGYPDKFVDSNGWEYAYRKGVKESAILTKAITDNVKAVISGTVLIVDKEYTVTAIGANAFKDRKNLKMVWLPATLSDIDQTAFSGCSNITHVSSSMEKPHGLDAIVFSSKPTLFVPKNCKANYKTDNFAYVFEGQFVDVATASDMTFDCYTDNADKKAILKKYNANASSVEIPELVNSYTVSYVTKQAFVSKTNMESLVIPSGVVTIEAETFNACTKLMWIESKRENPISISSNVFANYGATLFIPSNKVTEYENKGWKFLNIFVGDRKETTTSDGRTYVYSTGDKKAILTKVTTNDKDVTVDGTFKIGKDEYKVTAIAESVFKGKTKMESLKISENIENIGANAFQNCTKLEKVEFPATLKKIGSKAFDGCNGLVSLTCEGKEPAEIGADAFPSYNVTVNVPKDAVETYKNNQSWKQFTTILGMTTTVTDDSDGVYTITEDGNGEIWNGMDAEGDFVIQEEVMINGTLVQITAIAEEAFKDVLNLTGVTIPVTVKSIGASAFAGCSNLKSVTVYWNDPIALGVAGARGSMTRSSGSSIFEGVNLNTCILYVPAGCVEKYRNAAVWGDFKNILEIGTTAINGVVISEEGRPFDIYNMQGRKVRDNVTSFDGLPSGVYIVNGKKVMVK